MGIKGLVGIGVAALLFGGAILLQRRREGESYDRVQRIIKDVDLKHREPEQSEEEEEPKSVEAMETEVNQAFEEMDISDECGTEPNENKDIAEEKQITAVNQEIQKEIEREALYECIRKAIIRKDYIRLENYFEQLYNPYPYHEAPYRVYGEAKENGLITEEFENEAAKWYGKGWTYSGD